MVIACYLLWPCGSSLTAQIYSGFFFALDSGLHGDGYVDSRLHGDSRECVRVQNGSINWS